MIKKNAVTEKPGKTNGNGANLGFEAKLWLTTDILRNNMDAAEYKHVVLGLIFLKYISDSFEDMHQRLAKEMRDPTRRGEDLGLSDDEIAFYDTLGMNESAVQAMGIADLKVIAAKLVTTVRKGRAKGSEVELTPSGPWATTTTYHHESVQVLAG